MAGLAVGLPPLAAAAGGAGAKRPPPKPHILTPPTHL